MTDTVQFLSLNLIQPNPFQPRSQVNTDQLDELVASVREHGILEPLVIALTPAGYQIIAGERRWRAAKIVGLEEVPVLIKQTTPHGMLEMALVENVQRVDLEPMERARAFDQLHDFEPMGFREATQDLEIGSHGGKTRSGGEGDGSLAALQGRSRR